MEGMTAGFFYQRRQAAWKFGERATPGQTGSVRTGHSRTPGRTCRTWQEKMLLFQVIFTDLNNRSTETNKGDFNLQLHYFRDG